jgi:divalent metal cation (Fe/Co/Zn/Cd) transporter
MAQFDDARTARRVAIVGIVASSSLAALNIVVGIVARSTSVLAAGIEFAGGVDGVNRYCSVKQLSIAGLSAA